jgi:CIC family chloride channel protein
LISHSNQVIFAVVDKDKRLVGVVHFNNIREIIFNTYRVKYTLVKNIIVPTEIIYPTTKYKEPKVAFTQYYGFISKSPAHQ